MVRLHAARRLKDTKKTYLICVYYNYSNNDIILCVCNIYNIVTTSYYVFTCYNYVLYFHIVSIYFTCFRLSSI